MGCHTWLPWLIMMATTAAVCFARPVDDTSKVSLDLYYESLCPYSANFIIDGLAPIFKNGIIDIVDLKLYPWGNAKIRSDDSFTCQHGAAECLLNTVEACAIDANPSLAGHFPFIECVEQLVHDHKYALWETCFENSNLDAQFVKDCSFGQRGKELELKYAADTNSLKPPHKYVPWVVVDGEPLYEDYEDFVSYVCKAYKGTLPRACSGESSVNFSRKMGLRSLPVCFADKPISSWVPQTISRFVSSH